jgi:hypothetical protein
MSLEQEIAEYFYDNYLHKATQKVFMQNKSSAKALLNAGYTKEEIISCIDYLIANPPRNGFQSLAYLQYVINDVLIKLKAKELQRASELHIEVSQHEDTNNIEKFNNMPKSKIKGVFKI